jgi:hypothetical protein
LTILHLFIVERETGLPARPNALGPNIGRSGGEPATFSFRQ